jgi:hypothetical protein
LRDALCFGTRKDAFQLSTVPWPGSLPPRENAEHAVPKAEKPKSADKPKRPRQSNESAKLAAQKPAKPRGADKPRKPKQSKKPKQPSLFLDAAE